MSTLLFFLYAAVILWFIPRIPFMKKSGLGWKLLTGLFAIRALAGVVNCYLNYYYFTFSDSLTFHIVGLNEYYLLTNLPGRFFSDLFFDPYNQHYSGLFDVTRSFWNNLKMNVIVKSIAVADIFTLRNFYTNTLLFNFLVFFGNVAIYRVFSAAFAINRWIMIIFVFLFPVSLFYTSNLHRDGLVFLSVAMILYAMLRMLQHGFTIKRFLILVFFFLLMFTLRNFVSIVMLPALIAWWISHKRPQYAVAVFVSIFLFCVLIFFTARNFFPAADFPKIVADRRFSFEFISEISNTYLPLGALSPTFPGFLKAAPASIYHAFFLPSFWQLQSVLLLPFALELLLVWMLFILFLYRPKRKLNTQVCLFLTFFCLVNILMIGYTVPNLGAIVRYRSIYIHLLAICLLVSIDWGKINLESIFKKKNRFRKQSPDHPSE